jgi:hypothetical protein
MDKILELLGLSQFIQPKAHDDIDYLMQDNVQQPSQEVMNAVNQLQDPFAGMQRPKQEIRQAPPSQEEIMDIVMGTITPMGGVAKVAKAGKKAAEALARKKWWQRTNLTQKQKQPEYKPYDPNAPGQYIEGGKESAKGLLDNLFESFKGKEF